MPSNSYLSLLVIALTASTVSPVRCAETRQIEDREDSSSAPASGSRHHTRGGPGLATIGMGLTGFLLTVALITTFYPGGGKKNNPTPPNRPTQPTGPPSTNNTQPTSPPQPNNPPRTFVGREERDLDHGLPRDTSGEPYPNLHLDNIADGVLTTAGPSEVSSTNNEDGRISSSLDLLSRADLSKKIILFSRMLDKLD